MSHSYTAFCLLGYDVILFCSWLCFLIFLSFSHFSPNHLLLLCAYRHIYLGPFCARLSNEDTKKVSVNVSSVFRVFMFLCRCYMLSLNLLLLHLYKPIIFSVTPISAHFPRSFHICVKPNHTPPSTLSARTNFVVIVRKLFKQKLIMAANI